MQMKYSIQKLAEWAVSVSQSKGFNLVKPEDWRDNYYKIGTIIALIQSEASEALEAARKDDFENFKEELADVVIRVMDCCVGLNIDLEAEIIAKIKKNEKRDRMHGGKVF